MGRKLYNSAEYFQQVRVAESGFREYDARWRVAPVGDSDSDVEINYRGLLVLGNWLGWFLQRPENGAHEQLIVGHDFRAYSEHVKNALVVGLLASGIDVHDLGLCLTPTVYFSQYDRSVPGCAMVTASHNPNGWTGVKMGHGYSKTFGPDRMQAFKDFAREQGETVRSAEVAGRYVQVPDAMERYLAQLKKEWSSRLGDLPRLRVAVETGNGTAGLALPRLLEGLGFEVDAGNIEPDWDFPHFNPNPESVPFLRSVQALVARGKADVGLCIDGDGDRLGVVDDRGQIVFSDRVGLLIAKMLERKLGPTTFVVDVKSTSLFSTQLESRVVWEKTGHSYVKAAVARENATAGFERSGHFMFNPPLGRGYDDACVATLALLWILCEAKPSGQHLSDLLALLPPSHQSPNRQPKVPEERKYAIVEEIEEKIEAALEENPELFGAPVTEVVTINGVRLHFGDGSWLLVRASSNTPNLVILAESFDSDGGRLEEIDRAIRSLIADIDDVGPFEPLYET